MTSSTTKLIRLTTVTTRLIRRRPWSADHCQWDGGSHNVDVQSTFHDPWLWWCFEHISHLCLLDGELAEAAEEDGDDPGEHVPRTRPHVGTQLRWSRWWGWCYWFFYTFVCAAWDNWIVIVWVDYLKYRESHHEVDSCCELDASRNTDVKIQLLQCSRLSFRRF